ncbi:MAG: UDP-N-acetylmuramoyl-L-alanine--D-glutamate ligase [Candidatus Andersenbacteria bacterium]
MLDLEGKKVTVMGLGLHGGAAGTIAWLVERKARITVTDLKTDAELRSTLTALQHFRNVRYVLGEHREEDFVSTDLIIRNPGVPRTSKYLELARQANVPIEMDSSLFFQFCPTKNIIGVTGSKGKSTTVHAIAHLLQIKYPSTITVGDDRHSPLGSLSSIRHDSLVVFELSSWRLEALADHNISPRTAVVTSIYRDHLNTYDSFEDYIKTKKIIIRYQRREDRVLLNADDERLRQWAGNGLGQVYWYSLTNKIPDEGICVDRGMVTVLLKRGGGTLFPLDSLKLTSDHERRNVLPAILLGFMSNIPIASIQLNVSNLQGLAHRLEKVRVVDRVTYINDSAATMPDATIAATRALGTKHIVHILGGSDKKLRFEELARVESQVMIRALIFLPGDATPRLREQIVGEFASPPPVFTVNTMAEAVTQAQAVAEPGDVVLLSPAATSFGLFQHEFDRGDQFKASVAML